MRTPEPIPTLPPAADFRRALGQFATGVTVVTALDPESGQPEGVTVNAFASLSLEPPLILVCLTRMTRLALLLDSAGHFAVNVLAADQHRLSVAFARMDNDRFTGVAWRAWGSGAPILEGCVANLECSQFDRHDGGDHVIVVGRVERLACDENREPLLFARSDYHGLGGRLP